MPYQMPNGKWRAKRMIQGKMKTKVFPTKREAQKWEVEQSEDLWQQKASEILSVSYLEVMTKYLEWASERQSNKTLAEKKLSLRNVFEVFPADVTPEDITQTLAMKALRHIALKSTGGQANKARKNLTAAWAWAKKYYGFPAVNPFAEVERFPFDEQPRYVPPESDFWKVFNEATGDADKAFLLFLLHTGARMSESYRVQWSDVDFDRRQVRLGTRKTANGGMHYDWVPLTTDLCNALLQHRKNCYSMTYVFAQENGKPYTSRQHFMRRLCERAGVKPFGFHAIRHLSATILAHSGMDIPSVQSVLRHRNPNTTARYIKSLGVESKRMDEIFSTQSRRAIITQFEPVKEAV